MKTNVIRKNVIIVNVIWTNVITTYAMRHIHRLALTTTITAKDESTYVISINVI
jgi:hypothetical protein